MLTPARLIPASIVGAVIAGSDFEASGEEELYWFRDEFSDVRTAGQVNGSPCTPGPGVRIERGDGNTIGSGSYNWAQWVTSQNALFLPAITRQFGRVIIWKARVTGGVQFQLGLDTNTTIDAIGSGEVQLRVQGLNVAIRLVQNSNYNVNLHDTWPNNNNYQLIAFVLRSTGVYALRKWDSDTVWKLLPPFPPSGNTATLYPYWSNFNTTANDSDGKIDFVRVPARLFFVPVLAYDTFNRANGAMGSTESVGPDGQSAPALIWQGGTTWAVSSNAAVNSPNTGSELITNGDMEGGFTGGLANGWTKVGAGAVAADETVIIHGGSHSQKLTASVAGADEGVYQNAASNANLWYRLECWAYPNAANGMRIQMGSSYVRNVETAGAWNNIILTYRGAANRPYFRTLNTGQIFYLDDVSTRQLTLSELISSVQTASSNVIASVNVTSALGLCGGLTLCIDNAAAPANFILVYITRTSSIAAAILVEKCVAGVYTVVASTSVTYVAAAPLQVVKDGTALMVYYNNAVVGSTSTISDVGIINNTLHGLFSTGNPGEVQLDNFSVYPRGNGGEFDMLNRYITGG